MTLDGLWELFHRWVVDDYAQSPHRGIGEQIPGAKYIPARLWTQALERDFIPALPPNRDELLILVSRTAERQVHHYGIEFENIVYHSTSLRALRKLLKRPDAPKLVQIKYHPGDLSRIWVRNPFSHLYPAMRASHPKYTAALSHHYLEIPAVNQEYTAGLSLWKHRVIKRYLREDLKLQLNEDTLLQAKEEIQTLVNNEFRLNRKIRSRVGIARWLDIQVMSWMSETVQPPAPTPLVAAPSTTEMSGGEAVERAAPPIQQPTLGIRPLTEQLPDLSIPVPAGIEDVELLEEAEQEERADTPSLEPFPPLADKPVASKRPRRPRKPRTPAQGQQGADSTSTPTPPPAPPEPAAVPSPSFELQLDYTRPFPNPQGE